MGHARDFTAPPDASVEGAAGDADTSDATLTVDGADAGELEAGDGAQAADTLCDPSDQAQCRAIDAGCRTLPVPPANYFYCQ